MSLDYKANEEWLLRYLNHHCRGTSMDYGISFASTHWKDPSEAPENIEAVIDRMDWKTLDATIETLTERGFAGNIAASNGYPSVWITARGRDHLESLDNPDIVDSFQRWSRRNPCVAACLIGVVVAGAVFGFFRLLWDGTLAFKSLVEFVITWTQ